VELRALFVILGLYIRLFSILYDYPAFNWDGAIVRFIFPCVLLAWMAEGVFRPPNWLKGRMARAAF
jgi:hypothetical protein